MVRTRPCRAKPTSQTIRKATVEILEPRWLLSVPRQMEYLDRGVVGLNVGAGQIYVGWRLLGTDDPATTAFDVYRSTAGGAAALVNTGGPISTSTNLLDTNANTFVSTSYFVRPVISGVPQPSMDSAPFTVPASAGATPYLTIPLQPPPVLPMTNGSTSYTYAANDGSVGDVDGDGQYEIILKWDPSNSQDVANDGHTGRVYVDAYKLNGTRLWRIDMGINVRAGAHYTQMIVYDLDGDGRSEIAMRTSDGTVTGTGEVIGNPSANWVDPATGRMNSAPEYLTIFDGLTGAALTTVPFPIARGAINTWGDNYGNRSDRHGAAVAYLDGVRPSLVLTRGYNGPQSGQTRARTDIVALDWRNGQLTQRWYFMARQGQDGNVNSNYIAQGNHNLTVGDVDGDGKDEIIYGACAIDDNGVGLYSTGRGHGDAIHMSDMDPDRPGLEIFSPHESPGSYGTAGGDYRDADTGVNIIGIPADNDVGRGVAFDIDPNHRGYEFWAATNDPLGNPRQVYNVQDGAIYNIPTNPANDPNFPNLSLSYNFGIWWDADPLRELEDGGTPRIDKFNWTTGRNQTLLTITGTSSNNGTKSTPVLVGDILGDWREELIVRASNNLAMYIYSTTILATNRIYTLMHDSQYREAIAWQQDAYNQPPHPSFFLGANSPANDFPTVPAANLYTVQYAAVPVAPTNLTATVGGLNQINLAWSASAGAVNYNVKRRLAIGGAYSTIASGLIGTTYTDNTAVNGVQYAYAVVALDSSSVESRNSTQAIAKVPVNGSGTKIYQAEYGEFTRQGSNAANANAGYNDWGYIDFPSSGTTGFVDFYNVYGGLGGTTQIKFRYAATANRTGSLIINGVTQGITFISTGSNTTWSLHTVNVTLNPGYANTIRLQVTGADLANVDELQVTPNVDSTAPTITAASHQFLLNPSTLKFTFSEAVNPSIALSDLVVTLLGPNTTIVPTAFVYDTNTNIATYTLPVSMADGDYRATFVSGGVIDTFGNALPAGFSLDFGIFPLFPGDANHDRRVDVLDLVILGNNWLGTGKDFSQADFDGDGDVDQHDLGIMAQNWQLTAPATAPPLPAAPTTSRPPARTATRTPTRVIDLVQ